MNLSRHGTTNGGTAFGRSGGVAEGCFGVLNGAHEAYFEGFDPGSE